MKIQEQDKWMTPIIRYLKECQLLEDKNETHKRYRSKLLASSLLMTPSTDEDTLSPISFVSTRKKQTTYSKRYTKGSEVTMQERDLWWEKHLEQDITGQCYKRMHMTSSKHVTSANTSQMSKRDQVSQRLR